MDVIVPYADAIRYETKAALSCAGIRWFGIDVGYSDFAYGKFMDAQWRLCPWINVEQDIIPTDLALHSLVGCDQPWCAIPYKYLGRTHVGTGCMKFGAPLLREAPMAVDEAMNIDYHDPNHPPGHWCRLDNSLCRRILPNYDFRVHVHDQFLLEHAGHNGKVSSHGCVQS